MQNRIISTSGFKL